MRMPNVRGEGWLCARMSDGRAAGLSVGQSAEARSGGCAHRIGTLAYRRPPAVLRCRWAAD